MASKPNINEEEWHEYQSVVNPEDVDTHESNVDNVEEDDDMMINQDEEEEENVPKITKFKKGIDTTLQYFIQVRILYKSYSLDRLPDQATKEELEACMNKIYELFQTKSKIKFVSIEIENYSLTGTFYFKDKVELEEELVGYVNDNFPTYKNLVQLNTGFDPDWFYYKEHISPSAENNRWIETKKYLTELVAKGDHPGTERNINYYIRLPNETSWNALLEQTKSIGFELNAKKSQKPNLLVIKRTNCVNLPIITAIVNDLAFAAEALYGHFDSWTCKPVTTIITQDENEVLWKDE